MLIESKLLFFLLRVHQLDEGAFVAASKAVVRCREYRDAFVIVVHAETLRDNRIRRCTVDELL
jgi:hypothetical protein